MPAPKKAPQTHILEKELTTDKALEALEKLVAAESELDALPVAEVDGAKKRRADARAELLEAIPVAKKETIFRIGDYLIRAIPPAEKDQEIKFIRHNKSRLSFVDPDEE